jgi:hypothetical protein
MNRFVTRPSKRRPSVVCRRPSMLPSGSRCASGFRFTTQLVSLMFASDRGGPTTYVYNHNHLSFILSTRSFRNFLPSCPRVHHLAGKSSRHDP